MANLVSVRILFENEAQAESALAVTEGMIKLLYAPKELPWAAEAAQISSLSKRYFRFGGEAAKLDVLAEHPNCALKWLRLHGAQLVLERCADIQSPVNERSPGDFFSQLCLVLSKRFPDGAFTAFCRHEETVSATVQLIRILHRDNKLIFTEMYRLDGDERDEDDWSGAATFLLRDSDGVFVWSKR